MLRVWVAQLARAQRGRASNHIPYPLLTLLDSHLLATPDRSDGLTRKAFAFGKMAAGR